MSYLRNIVDLKHSRQVVLNYIIRSLFGKLVLSNFLILTYEGTPVTVPTNF